MLGSKNPTWSHDATPRSSKYITNAALGPSGEVADGPTASPLHCRRFSDFCLAASIACLCISTAWASEHQESNSDETRGKEGGYWCLLLVRQLW